MGRGLDIRQDITAVVLRKKARSQKDGRVAARMLSIADVMDGIDRKTAARSGGMTRQILRDWIERYNKLGLAGLMDRAKGHKKRALLSDQEDELKTLVLAGPDDQRVRWRLADLQAEIQKRFGVSYHERSVGKILRRLGFVRLSVRPLHPETDLEKQEAFKKTSQPIWQLSCPTMPETSQSKSGFKTKRVSGKKAHSPDDGRCVAHAPA